MKQQHLFQVNLGGIVDLFSRSLYSETSIFVRELLQNGIDAITARKKLGEAFDPCIRFITTEKQLTVVDNGIGLTIEEVKTLLATIGASSKLDDLGFSKGEFLGQFGIGLLSCFMVSRTITVYTRSAKFEDAPVVRWVAAQDGTWQVDIPECEEIPKQIPQVGTLVQLQALPEDKSFTYKRLFQSIKHYGRYLPVNLSIERENFYQELLNELPPPWELPAFAQAKWCVENFGFFPFDIIPLTVPVAGVEAVGFVLPFGSAIGANSHHLVYLRSMLLGTKVPDLLPEWAYFVRLVVNTQGLNPTASREQLFADELLEATREELGKQVRSWIENLARNEYSRFREFASVHVNGLKSLAVADRATRELVAEYLPFQTSSGFLTFNQVVEKYGVFSYCATDNEYRALERIFEGNGLCVANAGFAFDEEILGQLAIDRPQVLVREVRTRETIELLTSLSLEKEAFFAPFKQLAVKALAGQEVAVEVKGFEPNTMPVLFVPKGNLASKIIEANERESPGLFGDVLSALVQARARGKADDGYSQLIFNANCPVINEIAGAGQIEEALTSAVRGFYVQALLAGHHPMDQQARSWSATVFTSILSSLMNEQSKLNVTYKASSEAKNTENCTEED